MLFAHDVDVDQLNECIDAFVKPVSSFALIWLIAMSNPSKNNPSFTTDANHCLKNSQESFEQIFEATKNVQAANASSHMLNKLWTETKSQIWHNKVVTDSEQAHQF